jgi:hypothetical protein
MNEAGANQTKTMPLAFDYFVLTFCILVPTIGTLTFVLLLDYVSNGCLLLGGAIFVYLSSITLGLFNAKRFKNNHGRGETWTLIIFTGLSGISALVTIGVVILIYVAQGLHIQ